MNSTEILTLIDAEIAQLQSARALLTGTAAKKKPGRPKSIVAPAAAKPKTGKKRVMSPEGRARLVAAVKARWARVKKTAGRP